MWDHQNSWFPGAAGVDCCFSSPLLPFFVVSCLSFTALSEHKDVALVSDSCAVPSSGAALLQNSDGKTPQLGLDESSLGGGINLLNKTL